MTIKMVSLRQSLAFRVLGLSFILLALPLFVDSFVLMRERYKELFNQAERYLIEINKERELSLSQYIKINRVIVPLVTYYYDLEDHFLSKPSEKVNKSLHEIAQQSKIGEIPQVITLTRIDEEGNFSTVASSSFYLPKEENIRLPIYRYFRNKDFEPEYYSTIFYSAQTSQYYFITSYLVCSKEKKPLGLITITYFWKGEIEQSLKEDDDPYPVRFALLSPQRIVVAASDPTLVNHSFGTVDERDLLFLPDIEREGLISPPLPTISNKDSPFFRFPWVRDTQIGVIMPIEETPFFLLSYAAERDIYAKPFKDLSRTYWIYGLIFLVGGTAAFLMTRWLARPYRKLITVMEGIRGGKMNLRYQSENQGFEINVLGRTFNDMIESLLEKEKRAEEERVKREVYSHELKLGREVQRGLLPEKMPLYPGVVLVEHYLPAKEVGGDFYDIFIRERGGKKELVLVIADASGKGVQACFYSLGVRSYFRTLAMEFDDPATIMQESNRLFCQDTGDTGMFVTAVVAIYDGASHLLRYFSCGHNPPLLRRKNGEIIKLNKLGMAMGFKEKIEGNTQNVTLEHDDEVLFYTDGITEAHDENKRLFSEERLMRIFSESTGSLQEFTSSLLEEVKLFAGKAPQYDDITILGMKVL